MSGIHCRRNRTFRMLDAENSARVQNFLKYSAITKWFAAAYKKAKVQDDILQTLYWAYLQPL